MKDITRTTGVLPRLALGAMLALAVISLGLQTFVVRPRLYPAGAGLALSGDGVFGLHAAPRALALIRPPDVSKAAGTPIALHVFPGSAAGRAGIREGDEAFELSLNAPPFSGEESQFAADASIVDLAWARSPADRLQQWRLLQ